MALKRFQHVDSWEKRTTTGPRPPVLYVEDEDPNWDVACVKLADRYDMHRAKSSREAFEAMGMLTYRVVLMDIQLSNSDYNGIEISKILTNRFSGVVPSAAKSLIGNAPPIIFVTAYGARYGVDDVGKFGGDDLITKPVDFLRLTSAITRCFVRSIRSHGRSE